MVLCCRTADWTRKLQNLTELNKNPDKETHEIIDTLNNVSFDGPPYPKFSRSEYDCELSKYMLE